jgi:hypothetical protein
MKLPTLRQTWRAMKKQSVSTISLALSLGMFAFDTVRPTQVPVGSLSTLGGNTGTISLSLIALALAITGITLLVLGRRKN